MNELQNRLFSQILKQIEAYKASTPQFKTLEFACGNCSVAEEMRETCEFLALTDKNPAVLESFRPFAAEKDISLIPDEELDEDCYFGRFHLIYTLFGFRNLPHLVDEIMRLRRLIIKGGQMIIIDEMTDNFSAECQKQLKRCGFTDFSAETFPIDGKEVFLLAVRK